MIQLTEPQVWVLIGVFATSMFGMLRMTHRSFTDLLRAEIGGLRREMRSEIGGIRDEMRSEIGGIRDGMRSEMGGLRGELRSEIGGLRAEMNARFDVQDTKISHLDRDIQVLFRRVFPEYPEAS